jgi:hypothetical protein
MKIEWYLEAVLTHRGADDARLCLW